MSPSYSLECCILPFDAKFSIARSKQCSLNIVNEPSNKCVASVFISCFNESLFYLTVKLKFSRICLESLCSSFCPEIHQISVFECVFRFGIFVNADFSSLVDDLIDPASTSEFTQQRTHKCIPDQNKSRSTYVRLCTKHVTCTFSSPFFDHHHCLFNSIRFCFSS